MNQRPYLTNKSLKETVNASVIQSLIFVSSEAHPLSKLKAACIVMWGAFWDHPYKSGQGIYHDQETPATVNEVYCPWPVADKRDVNRMYSAWGVFDIP